MLAEMGAMLRSTGENGVREYELLAPLVAGRDPIRGEILEARRTQPPDLTARMIIKHAPRRSASFADLREDLLDEALEAASTLHPNLSAVADVIENDDGMYLVLEHVDGIDLATIAERLRARAEAMSFELTAYVLHEILKAMHHLHTTRDPHGKPLVLVVADVAPQNVLISANGRVKLANRSLAEALEQKRRRSAAQLFAYFAPECIAGEPFSIASDLYSVGVMLWEMLVGRRCFGGETKDEVLGAILKRGVPVKDMHLVNTPSRLQAIVEKATSFVPERRYASAIEMARAIEVFLRENAPSADIAPLLAQFLVSAKLIEPESTEQKMLPASFDALPPSEHATIVEHAILSPDSFIPEVVPEPAPQTSTPPVSRRPSTPPVREPAPMREPAITPRTPIPVPRTPTSRSSPPRAASISTRPMREQRVQMPPAAFPSAAFATGEAVADVPKDVKSRTLMLLVMLSLAILAVILIFINSREDELNEMDRAIDSRSLDLRDRYAPKR
jgi:serine/threonine protein kinase